MLQQMTVGQFMSACNDARVFYDRSFQRRFGAWIRTQENRFLLKLFKGKAHTLIVVADIAACLEHSRATGQINSERAFEKILARGFTFISLDGQHRTKTILKYFNNEATLTGTFVDVLGKEHILENVFWKDAPDVLRSQFMTAPISLSKEVDSLYEELSQHFRDLNSGSATNDQEDRNSYSSPIAKVIRAWRIDWRIPLSRIVKSADVLRMGDDELLVKFTMALLRSYKTSHFTALPNLTKESLDAFYTIGISASGITSATSPYDPQELARAKAVLKMAMTCFEKQTHYSPSQMIAAKTAWAVVLASAWAHDNEFVITDYEEFFNAVKKNDDDLIDLGERAYITAKDAKIQKGEDPNEVVRGTFYHAWTPLPHQKGARSKRQVALSARLDTYVTNNDLVSLAVAEAKDLAA